MKNAYDCVNKIDELLQKNTMFDLLAWINSNELIYPRTDLNPT